MINVDAAFKCGDTALALVARNWKGELLEAAAICCTCTSAKKAELQALSWASKVVMGHGWQHVTWQSDAKALVDIINSADDPLCWETQNAVLHVRNLLSNNSWSLKLSNRETNQCAYFLAKPALCRKHNFSFLDVEEKCLPPGFIYLLLADAAAIVPSL